MLRATTLCLYQAGYDFKRLFTLSEFYDRDRARFYRALQQVREQNLDLTGWLEFFIDGLATQLAEVKAAGERAIRRDVIVNRHNLNPRQAAAVDHLLHQGRLDIRTYSALCPGVSRRTLQRDLGAMESKGLLLHEGETNNFAYMASGKW